VSWLLRYWLFGTAIVLVGLGVWALAPVLAFLVLLAAALGLLSFGMIGLARALEAWRKRGSGQASKE
jgi:hypothetical protein